MTEVTKSKALVDAEGKLKELEKFAHATADANVALGAAKATADPEKIAAAQKVHDAAVAAEADVRARAKSAGGDFDRALAEASQAVLDARGEAHTETNILPPDLGIRTVEADADLVAAQARKSPAKIKAAEAALEEAVAADAKEKEQHVDESHQRTLAAMEESKS